MTGKSSPRMHLELLEVLNINAGIIILSKRKDKSKTSDTQFCFKFEDYCTL